MQSLFHITMVVQFNISGQAIFPSVFTMNYYTVFKGSRRGSIVEAVNRSRPLQEKEVRVKITSAGLCSFDTHFQGVDIVLGHEGVGVVQETGPHVTHLEVGHRVGWGYHHSSCNRCDYCLRGNSVSCPERELYGFHDQEQGAFATSAVWSESTLIPLPAVIEDKHAAPLMCAGATVFSALKSLAKTISPGSTIGVLGLGGLGHLAVKFASKMGFRVVVISTSAKKRVYAQVFGAHQFYDLETALDVDRQSPLALEALLVTTGGQLGRLQRLLQLL